MSFGKNPINGGSPARESSIRGSMRDIIGQVFILLFICANVLILVIYIIIKIGNTTIIYIKK
jgi:ABC-type multidrug transport system permease subunit